MSKEQKTRYKLIKQIGAGDFAKVYAADDVKLGRKVAIKQIHGQYMDDDAKLARYWQEAKLLLDLEHPNIMTIYDVVKTRGRLILELMQGSLKQIYGNKPMPVDDVRQTIRQAAKGLACLHQNGIIHGDIKPANLMLSRQNVVKLGDFGLARRANNEEGSLLKGTTKYMAPELVSEEFGAVGPPSDLYSLGFTALELMVGPDFDSLFPDLVAFGRDKQMAWMMWHCSADRQLPIKAVLEGVPDDLATCIEKLTSKDQSKRYQTANQVVADLSGHAKPVGQSLKEEEAAAAQLAKKQKTKKRMIAGLACCMSLIACALIYFFTRPKPPEVVRVPDPPVAGVVMNVLPFDDKFVLETDVGSKEYRFIDSDELKLNRRQCTLRDYKKGDRVVVNTHIDSNGKDQFEVIGFRPEKHTGVVAEIKLDANEFVLTVKEGVEEGSQFELLVSEDTEIIVNESTGKEDAPFGLAELQPEDQVIVNLSDAIDGMVALKVDATRRVKLEGDIIKLEPLRGTMTIAEKNSERLVTLPLDPACTFSLNGDKSLNNKLLTASSIQNGDRVTIIHDVKILQIDAYRPFADKGSIRSVNVANNSILLKSQQATQARSYSIGPQTRLSLGGDIVTIEDLRAGDTAQLVHDSPGDVSPTLLSLTVDRPKDRGKWAILIGNQKFDSPSIKPLDGPLANIESIKRKMTGRFGIREDQVKVFENESSVVIEQEIPSFLRSVGSRDEVFIYCSTRGFIEKGKGAYLAAKESAAQELDTSGLRLDWLIDTLDACKSQKKILFLEIQNEGQSAKANPDFVPASATEMVQTVQTIKRGGYPKQTYVLANAQPGDGSPMSKSDPAMTNFGAMMSEAFAGKADREKDTEIEITELTTYVADQTTSLARSANAKQTPFLFTPDDRPPRLSDKDQQDILSLLSSFSQTKIDAGSLITQGRRLTIRTNNQPEPMLGTGLILIKSFKMKEAMDILEEVRLRNRNRLLAHQGVIWLHMYKKKFGDGAQKLQEMLSTIKVPEADEEPLSPTVMKKFAWAGQIRELAGSSIAWKDDRVATPEQSVLEACDKLVARHGANAMELYQSGRASIKAKVDGYNSALEEDPSSDAILDRRRIKSYSIEIATQESIQEIIESLKLD